MGLIEYKRKRHFQVTPEPAGKEGPKGGRSFVIQKHAASHLHYDFRLELDGVLKSWAVPKGPSLDPKVKRLAMQVEDHPIEYGGFEGIIPQGEYGGGTVMLWDEGEWEPLGDAAEEYRTGKLKFKLNGQKLHGAWMLLRTRGGPSEKEKPQWLLFKERDDTARPAEEGDILEEAPLSVRTGRTMDQIAADRDWTWNSNAKPNPKSAAKPAAKSAQPKPRSPDGKRPAKGESAPAPGVKASMPKRIDVELATLARDAPPGDEWLHEIKFDGYRMICRIVNGRATFISRNHQDWTDRFRVLAEAAPKLPVSDALFDGEVVAVRPDGTTNFQDLQNAFREGRAAALQYYIFDLLYLDGRDLTGLPLEDRKGLLAKLLATRGVPAVISLSQYVEGNGPEFLKQACKLGLEGIVSKRRDRPYRAGRSYDWLKVKCVKKDEFVIGGYTEPAGERTGFGALLVGYHNPKGDLVYAGKVGTGFDQGTLGSLLERMRGLKQDRPAFIDPENAPRKAHWIEPTLVAQVVYGAWTNDGLLRHASFQGLREDKPASEVTRDQAIPAAAAQSKSGNRKTPRKQGPSSGPNADAKSKRPTGSKSSSRRNGTMLKTKKEPKASMPPTADYDAGKQQFAGVRLTHPEKVLYPEQGITKLELANYYHEVADWVLPHIVDRPLVLVRCPEGRAKECFYQKHPALGTPDTLRRIAIKEKSRTEDYVIADNVAGLVSLAQIGALRDPRLGLAGGQARATRSAYLRSRSKPRCLLGHRRCQPRQVRQFLQDLGLESFVKTTGGKGLHLVVPIDRRHDWDEAKAFCKAVADAIVAADPVHYTANMSKAARPGKIFIDYLRNGRGATAIIPYSTRARPDAPISVPLTWKELSEEIHSDHFNVRNIGKRLAGLKRDPWEGIAATRQSLTGALKQLEGLGRR